MEKLSKHIETLLAYHDYVVVPNLGGFVLQNQSAEIYPEKIIAPRTTIGFNPLMKHADGLLAIELARTEGITYRKAIEIIEVEVEHIFSQLQNNKIIPLGKLGTLSLPDTGNIHFEPVTLAEFLPSNFEVNNIHISQRRIADDNNSGKITFTLPKISTVRNVAAAVLLFVMMGISQQLNDVRKTEFADLSSVSFANIPEVTVKPDPCPQLEFSTVNDTQVVTNDSELYHVVVASLPTKSMADRYCDYLKTQNYNCAHVLTPEKTYRVSIQSFSDKDQAIEFMEGLRSSDEQFSQAWVLCKH